MEGKWSTDWLRNSMDKLNVTLTAVKSLRSSVRKCFEHLADGTNSQFGDDCRTGRFMLEFQENFNNINAQLRDVENLINGLQVPPGPYYLGNTNFLAQETTQERQALYPQLVNSYKWLDKVHDHSFLAFNNLNQNSLRRSYTYCSQKRGRMPFSSCINADPDYTDKLLSELNHLHSYHTFKVSRPFGANAVSIVTISRILKAAIVFKGVLIEWVTIRAFDEPLDHEDLWAESRHEVFRKVQEHTHSAMLHFFSPTLPDLAVKSYMTWLNSYSKLFLEPCKRCGRFLSDTLPPTWRDLRTLEPFHEECRNC